MLRNYFNNQNYCVILGLNTTSRSFGGDLNIEIPTYRKAPDAGVFLGEYPRFIF